MTEIDETSAPAQDNFDLPEYRLFIHGESVAAEGGQTFVSEDPFVGRPWARVADAGPEDVDRAVASAKRAFEGEWGSKTGFERAAVLRRVADAIAANAERLATLEVRDNGKLMREMRAQLLDLPNFYYYYAGLADKIEGRTVPAANSAYLGFTYREPLGVVGAITPWNSPLLLLTMKLAPLLAAGNTCVAKPSEFAPTSTLVLAEILFEAGLPAGAFNVVTSSDPTIGSAIVEHPDVEKVAFTGSSVTGAKVSAAAAIRLKRSVLELGGKSAQVVFPDADLNAAANGIVAGIFAATGQSCVAGSRVLVHESVRDELLREVVRRANQIKLGDPNEPATEMGPVANRVQYDKVLSLIETARAEGATFECGGGADESLGGLFIRPTVVTGAGLNATITQQEVFGPVLVVDTFATEEEALAKANGTDFGLAGSVWTKDIQRAHRVAQKLDTGVVWINAYRVMSPAMPMAGRRSSGLGLEGGMDVINEFTTVKSVWVELSGATRDPFTLG